MKNNKILIILSAVGLYLLSTGISYALFSNIGGKTDSVETTATKDTNDYEALDFDSSKPRTEECPLNGIKYSKDQKKWWETHRPLGVMIENSTDARPQSGLSFADVIYEAIAEGGITRFLSVYYCQDAGIVGPVRSARTYFLDFISEYGAYPLYAHVGGANTPGPADALGQIIDYGWNVYNDLNQFSIGFPTFRRDDSRLGRSVATEHTMYSTTSKLWEVGKERGLTNEDREGDMWDDTFVKYSFKDEAPIADRPETQKVMVTFWDSQPNYSVVWNYDKAANVYKRVNGGSAHVDNNTKKQLATKNVVILYMRESRANDGYEGNLHELFGTKGSGNVVIFQNGEEIKGKWKKIDREGRTELTDLKGNEIEFVRGQIWFQIVPNTNTIDVQ
ncbi:MAG: DUF3048 domain-containing protein [Candidatus Levybacteria bacterium]|nr:DUF3048 domain-containing protein [Candidatus Levybacteria bacterium]